MKKFILIDQSIDSLGGHHYEYAVHVLKAAEKAGYTPVLATNRRFDKEGRIGWEVHPVYKYAFWPRLTDNFLAYRAARLLRSIKQTIGRVKIQLFFSPLGFFLSERPVDAPPPKWWLSLEHLWNYCVRVYRSSRRVLCDMISLYRSSKRLFLDLIPFKEYPARFLRWLKVFVRQFFDKLTLLSRSKIQAIINFYKRRRARQFGKDTTHLFQHVPLQREDIIFIPTISPSDMTGLLRYFTESPDSLKATWHLLFRRNLYTGRDSDYEQQDGELTTVRNAFLQFRSHLNGQLTRFYTDTEELTSQYNRLGVFPFKTLPIPHTRPPGEYTHADGSPLRITYIGDARSEKGYHYLPRIVQDLWADYVENKKIVFVLQSNYSTFEGEAEAIIARSQLEQYPAEKVRLIKEALPSEEYSQVLTSADINLLLYDGANYYARSSGILIESLAAGVPVMVPAGTWLSRQLTDEIYRYHSSLEAMTNIIVSICGADLQWHRQGDPSSKLLSDDGFSCGVEELNSNTWLDVPKGAKFLLLRGALLSGSWIRVYTKQYQTDEALMKGRLSTAEKGSNDRFSLFVPIEKGAEKILLGFQNDSDNALTDISDIRIDFLTPRRLGQNCPSSAVGVIYSWPEEISDLLREMIDNYGHYRATALTFAGEIYKKHNADRLVKALEDAYEAFPVGYGEEVIH